MELVEQISSSELAQLCWAIGLLKYFIPTGLRPLPQTCFVLSKHKTATHYSEALLFGLLSFTSATFSGAKKLRGNWRRGNPFDEGDKTLL